MAGTSEKRLTNLRHVGIAEGISFLVRLVYCDAAQICIRLTYGGKGNRLASRLSFYLVYHCLSACSGFFSLVCY